MTEERWLKLLQLFYQGINLIAVGLKRLIEEFKHEIEEQSSDNNP